MKIAVARYAEKHCSASENSLKHVKNLLKNTSISLEDDITVLITEKNLFTEKEQPAFAEVVTDPFTTKTAPQPVKEPGFFAKAVNKIKGWLGVGKKSKGLSEPVVA